MNIGFDGSRAFNSKKTGTENYSYQLLKNLSKIDQKNKYHILVHPNSHYSRADWPKNFQFIIIPLKKLWTQIGLAAYTFQHQEIDVLFVPSHTLPLFRRSGLKTVITVHDLGAEYLPKSHQLKQRLYLNLMTHHQLKTASQIIAVSDATRKDIIKRVGIDPDKIKLVYEGFDKSLFKPVKKDLLKSSLKQFDLEPLNYFLFVGTIQPRKNLERLIQAYHKLTTYLPADKPTNYPTLVLAGSKGWLSDQIYQLPKKLGIEDKVRFLGYVEDKDLPTLYNGALAFLFPSLFEGFGLPILEAMACGCPVLTSDTSSMPEVAGKAAILVNPESVDDISEGIDKIYQNPHLRDRLRDSGFDQVKKFSWEKCARETLEILEETALK